MRDGRGEVFDTLLAEGGRLRSQQWQLGEEAGMTKGRVLLLAADIH
jgi:hypothetical protein